MINEKENTLSRRLVCQQKRNIIMPSVKKLRKISLIPPLANSHIVNNNKTAANKVLPPSSDIQPDGNPRMTKIPISSITVPVEDDSGPSSARVPEPAVLGTITNVDAEAPSSARVSKVRTSSWSTKASKDLTEWKKHPLYTPFISDEEWMSQKLPYYFIWQYNALNVQNDFVYLDYAEVPTPNMYCLVPISSSEVNANSYFTLSIEGLTHYKGGHGTFLEISQWLREVELYRRVGEVRFFKNFLQIYSFRSLHNAAISKKNTVSSDAIGKKYLIASQYFRVIGDGVRRLTMEIRGVPLIDLKFGYPTSLKLLLEKQAVHIVELRNKFEGIRTRVRELIVSACEASHSASGELGDATGVVTSLDQLIKQASKESKMKNSKKVRADEENMPTVDGDAQYYTRVAKVRSCCRKITKFIRACDLQVMQALLECVNTSAKQFVDFFVSTPQSTPLSVEYMMDHFDPEPDQWVTQISQVWEELCSTTNLIERFLYSPDFHIYTEASLAKLDKYREVELTQKFKDVLGMDARYHETMSHLEPNIRQVFSELKELTDKLQPYLDIDARCQALTMNFEDDSAKFFQGLIAGLRADVEFVDEMPDVLEHRIVQIQLKAMKSKITPSPRRCIEMLRKFLPQLVNEKAVQLDKEITDLSEKLEAEIRDVFHFGDVYELYIKLVDGIEEYRVRYHALFDLFNLCGTEGFSIDPEVAELVRSLNPKYAAFESTFTKIGETKEILIRKWGEQVKKEISILSENIAVKQTELGQLTDNVEESLELIKPIEEAGEKFQQDLEHYNNIQMLIGRPQADVDGLHIFITELKNKKTLYTTYKSWGGTRSELMKAFLKEINAEEFQANIQTTKRTADFLARNFPTSKLALELRESVTDIYQLAPVISTLRSTALEDRHWSRIEGMLPINGLRTGDLRIQNLVENGAPAYSEEFAIIAVEAENEQTLVKMIEDILIQWAGIKFEILTNADTNVLTLGGLTDVTDALDETLVKCSTIRSSRYVGPIKSRVDKTIVVLNRVGKMVELISSVQKQWQYLRNIFKDSDIQRQLSNDFKSFHEVEKEFKNWVYNIRDKPRVYGIAAIGEEPLKILASWDKRFETIQKAIEAFLMSKRTEFPRFFFLSNDDLIEILSLGKNPAGLQKHLNKLFENIYSLRLIDDGHSIDAMVSKEGETVPIQTIAIRGPVEGWLKSLEQNMRRAIQLVSADSFAGYASNTYDDWTAAFPGQTIISVTQIYFNQLVCENFNGNLDKALAIYEQRLKDLAKLVRSDLNKIYREILVALITIEVHNRDIISDLMKEGICDPNDFEWTKRLRYFFEDNKLLIRQHDATIEYGYEYLGATPRLIITPLTERCYLTLTTALRHHLGGSPSGPAGTGKTETVKDLAKALANFCVVFNCSEAVTAMQMQAFFSGLSQTGAWACFDEFNRIDPGVLSVIAEQVRTIQDALNEDAQTFMFCGKMIPLNPRCGVFITMNPGYAGRTELPDNLKTLFRPIAMTVPDYALIAEIFLYGQGFENARVLAEKITQLYKLSSEMLSPQSHYDYGMRALKSVLSMAGLVKRQMPDNPEDEILIQAINNSNIPKLLGNDKNLFQSLVNDLFQDVVFETILDPKMIEDLQNVLRERNLDIVDPLVVKTIQLYETMRIRHGVMLVGPTGGGKSVSLTILGKIMDANMMTLNPKSIELSKMYGAFNENTGEWFDGIVSKMFREAVADETGRKQWIIFDGPVDALWIENMNTVLDDNKMLSLANSQRLKMTDEMEMVFEVGDLSQASPATVSRCGMVYYEPSDIPWTAFCYSWFAQSQMKEANKEELKGIIEALMSCLRDFPLGCSMTNGFQSCMSFFESIMKESKEELEKTAEDVYNKKIRSIFGWSFCWAFGGSLPSQRRIDFDTTVRDVLNNKFQYPQKRTIFDYFLAEDCMTFVPWSELAEKAEPNENFVATEDTIAFSALVQRCVLNGRHVMISGPSGGGKSTIILNALKEVEEKVYTFSLTLSAQTSATQIQDTIETKMESKKKTLLGPPEGKTAAFLVDDVIMPKPETYGAQPPLELLRQYLGYGGFFNMKDLSWIDVKDMTLVAAGQPPGGGRNNVSPRFASQFTVLFLNEPSPSSLKRIFTTVLSCFFGKNKFHESVKSTLDSIVTASVNVFEKVCAEFLPTPSRSHYTFNLRDLSHVFTGIKNARPEVIYRPEAIGDLWEHENLRIYGDRLVDNTDRNTFMELITAIKKRSFKAEEAEEGKMKPLFVDFMSNDGFYRPYDSMKKIRERLNQIMDERLPDKKFVFFDDAIRHLCRLCRVLKQPCGNMMLVGVGGTGKRTTAKLAATVCDYLYAEPKLTNRYTRTEFRDDLKELYLKTGIEGKSIVFMMSDEHIINESFLEDINCILNNGEVPNLFDADEIEKIVTDMTPVIKKLNLSFARDVILNTFIDRVRTNLHVVLALSPIGEKFRTRTNMFPSLVNCCTIDWFDIWTDDALKSVALAQFGDIDFSGFPTVDGIVEKLAAAAMGSHSTVTQTAEQMYNEVRRLYYVTPAAYIDFMNSFAALLRKRQKKLEDEQGLLQRGCTKIEETNSVVGTMEQELTALKPVLAEKAAAGEVLLQNLERDKKVLEETKANVEVEKEAVQKMANEASALAAKAKSERDAILPMLEEAMNAVEVLKTKKSELSAVKTYKNPPHRVKLVMSAVCSLTGMPTDWKGAQTFLAKPNNMSILAELHNQNITDKDLQKIRPYLNDPEFTEELVAEQSGAAACLCKWVIAIDKFIRVRMDIEPLEKRCAEAQATLDEAQGKLNAKQAELNELENSYNELRAKLQKSLDEQKELETKIKRTQIRLENASKLTTALNSEHGRWTEMLQDLTKLSANIVGDTFLIAVNMSYLGPFPPSYRALVGAKLKEIIKEQEVPFTEGFTLESAAGDSMEIRDWRIAGLPSDSLSTENGILVTQSTRWPLLIDPQEQGFRWYCKINEENGLQIVRPGDSKLGITIENAVRMGTPIVVEGVEETIDPALKGILTPQIRKGPGGTMKIMLDGKEVDYDPNFRIILVTKIQNPVFLPDVFIQLSVINFAVTPDGLVEQLLTDVVRLEKPEVDEARTKLVVEIAQNKKLLDSQMKKILNLLFKSEGNILDNEELIVALQEAKAIAEEVAQRIEQAEVSEKQNAELCEIYRSVAVRGSILFFTLPDLPGVDPMYQYSLEFFKNLFINCILVPHEAPDVDTRLKDLIDLMTYRMYASVSRGLFAKHQVFYAFLLITSVLRGEKVIPESEWDLLVRGPSNLPDEDEIGSPDESINSFNWRRIVAIGKYCKPLENLASDISSNFEEFREFFISERTLDLPKRYDSLTPFQRVLLIATACPRKLIIATVQFIIQSYGQRFAQPPDLSITSAFADTGQAIPLVFVLSQGADPLPTLRSFADKSEAKLHPLSLGQGQGPIAQELIKNARQDGGWVFLQNCHLYTSWLPVLSDILRDIRNKPKEVHQNFRLFLSSMPTPEFPFSILQESVKVTSEPPRGLALNMNRLLSTVIDPVTFDSNTATTQRFLLALSFFAALIQERKKFGPLGWNIIYEWSDSDFRMASLMLISLMRDQTEIQWKAMINLVGQIAFGGRVTDDWDRRCLLAHLTDILSEKLLKETFTLDSADLFTSPAQEGHQAILSHVETYPTDDPPEIFGLHLNAQMSAQTSQSGDFIDALQAVQGGGMGTGGGGASDQAIIEMAEKIQADIPRDLVYREPEDGIETSLHVILRQEIIRFNRLLKVVRESVANLINAVRGLVAMSDELAEMYRAFNNGKVPNLWSNAAYPSLKPLVSWVADLVKRVEFIRLWSTKGEPTVFWIGGFFFPQSFMTGILQGYSRKHKVPVNSLRFKTVIVEQPLESISTPPEDGVYIHGMFFDGADWDREQMIMKDPKVGTTFSPAPVIHLIPQPDYEMPKTDFACPVYRTMVRAGVLSSTGLSTNFVVSVHLPVKESPTFWILRGAALLLSTPN